ncbi:hypothetical protein RclHR1_20450001 [Rhizophagus clarus]|uniref:RNase H type-1 domain-containing protein n=1 Tax=Rhizophagus clarus TaxID=94130 RepID=A0A2Z6QRF8_9GLOM|nr:hypothetical protein RclHR1_20450001 [Rhizophagus clarus]GES98753.1 hypothetical protein RCL_jg5625.t1 [Rhizophagus clarus]
MNNNNKLELSCCQGCEKTTSFYTSQHPRKNQLQESFCNIDCTISNTLILYIGQHSTVTRDRYCLIPVNINSHLQQAINHSILLSVISTIDKKIIINNISSSHLCQPDNQFLQHFEYNIKLEALYDIQQHLKDEDDLTFYTDGSLINANTQAASMSAGFICILDMNNITHSFTSTIENWPSSLRAELFAILLTLVVLPQGC